MKLPIAMAEPPVVPPSTSSGRANDTDDAGVAVAEHAVVGVTPAFDRATLQDRAGLVGARLDADASVPSAVTCTGTFFVGSSVPMPSAPRAFEPQHSSAPVPSTAQT